MNVNLYHNKSLANVVHKTIGTATVVTGTAFVLPFDERFPKIRFTSSTHWDDFNYAQIDGKYYCEDCVEDTGYLDEEEFKNSTITVNGVTYYTLGWLNYGAARLCEFTDTAIKLCDDSQEIATLSLRKDGTLVIDSVAKDEYGPVGTIFKMK